MPLTLISVPNSSITAAKLATHAVTSQKLRTAAGRLLRTTNLSIAAGATGEVVVWGSSDYLLNMTQVTGTGAGSGLVTSQAGIYRITARVAFAANATGYRQAVVLVDGSAVDIDTRIAFSSDTNRLEVNTELALTSGQAINLRVAQTSGAALDMASAKLSASFVSTIVP